MVEKIPFKVSSRTARLIGRESVATAKGAVIELVKNGYDADSQLSIVYFDNYYANFHDTLTPQEYETLKEKGIDGDLLTVVYQFNPEDNRYTQNKDVAKDVLDKLIVSLKPLTTIYIIDNGDGMTEDVIKNNWMTIGTDNKEINIKTKEGRIKVGAKGIGRFALDKLGEKCEMITFTVEGSSDFSEEKQQALSGYKWTVEWNDFEGASKTIDSVNASLERLENTKYSDYINFINLNSDVFQGINANFSHGTLLKITSSRDIWDDDAISQIFDDLGVLLPPAETNEFKIYLFASNAINEYGKVEGSVCDDYDYKLEAVADDNQQVKIRVYRQEYDLDKFPDKFFENKDVPFTKEDFERGYWETNRSFSELCPGFKDIDHEKVFNDIGRFKFIFYYLKRSARSDDEKNFCYRKCAYNLRKVWLDKYGGIKIFRDDFRVRPYGEKNNSAFDWLGLGAKKAKNPAGVGKKEGGYNVEPENVAGIIKISRIANVNFEDKSSREGLQENKAFNIFKEIIKGLIRVFEDDRSKIARDLAAVNKPSSKEKADKIATDVLRDKENNSNGNPKSSDSTNNHYEALVVLAEAHKQQTEEIDQLREEQKMLMALASGGLMLASFSHELSKLNNILESRYETIKRVLNDRVSPDVFQDLPDRKNPMKLLDKAHATDEKIQNWLQFAIGTVRKDKRKRKNIRISSYLTSLKAIWEPTFIERGIEFDLSKVEDGSIRAFEIDLDSIFHNLFANSIEAFINMRVDRDRVISVTTTFNENSMILEYYDSAEGLSKDIVNPDDIFKPFFTTKRNQSTGEEIGTGLGMWIVKSVVDDNGAEVKLLSPEYGFGIRFIFHIKNEQNG